MNPQRLAVALAVLTFPLASSASTFGARLIGEAALIGSGMLLAQADAPIPTISGDDGAAPREPQTLSELRAKRSELEDSKPKLGGWIAMISVGVPVAALGIGLTVYLVTNYGAGYYLTGLIFEFLTGLLGFVGVALAVAGTILLAVMAAKRARIGDEVAALDRRIEELERNPGYPPQPPPLPPPPPPSTYRDREGPAAAVVLASF
jgi:hypothetical protein